MAESYYRVNGKHADRIRRTQEGFQSQHYLGSLEQGSKGLNYTVTMLGDDRLSERSNASMRAIAMQSAQRTHVDSHEAQSRWEQVARIIISVTTGYLGGAYHGQPK